MLIDKIIAGTWMFTAINFIEGYGWIIVEIVLELSENLRLQSINDVTEILSDVQFIVAQYYTCVNISVNVIDFLLINLTYLTLHEL